MGLPERRLGSRLSLTNYLVALLLLCLVSLLVTCRQANPGRRYSSVLENILLDSLASSEGGKQVKKIQTGPRYESSRQDERRHRSSASRLAGLNCDAHGGPSEAIANEMVYWEDIPSDSFYVSPFKKDIVTQYLTFEPDSAGWNNVRMAMETVVALAVAMGRTLVLPPKQPFLFAGNGTQGEKVKLSFSHFFSFDYVGKEHFGIDFITMQEFLEREALKGSLRDKSGKPSFPQNNITDWNGRKDIGTLYDWLRNVTHVMIWNPDDCLAVFPASPNSSHIQALKDMKSTVEKAGGFPPYENYVGQPIPVNATTVERLKESWAERTDLCIYDEKLQNTRIVHFPFDDDIPEARLLAHFYSFLFFQDWKQDLWMKRFIRDHLRYRDHLQCAAARIVNAIRVRARARGDPDGNFDSFHVRRGDFIDFVNETQVTADQIYEIAKKELTVNATIYIATNEMDSSYFDPLRKQYDVVFLSDFAEAMFGLHSNFHGIIDQLVASRGRVFFGCFFSTFTNYINRLRGYHANRIKAPGFRDGIIDSWYYAPADNRNEMRKYHPVHLEYFEREFPASWRLIDTGLKSLDEQRR